MRLHYSLKIAQELLHVILQDPQADSVEATIECYQNGREQGYAIISRRKNTAILFSQCRNSDSISVYHGNYIGEKLTEEMYRNGKYFLPDCYQEAKDYIYSLLLADHMK